MGKKKRIIWVKLECIELNGKINNFKFIDDVVSNGDLSLTMKNQLTLNSGYLIFFRTLSGEDSVFPMNALLLYVRTSTYNTFEIGNNPEIKGYSMSNARLSVNFTKGSWTRMVVYRVI